MHSSRLTAKALASTRAAAAAVAATVIPTGAALLLCVPAAHAQIVVNNSSFEANAADFNAYPGYINNPVTNNDPGNPSFIAGWTSNNYSSGINTASGPFAGNSGAIPDGTAVAFLQATAGDPLTSISQTLTGLTPGQQYTVTFAESSRNGYTAPDLTVALGGVTVYSATAAQVTGTDPYAVVTTSAFTAVTNTADLVFSVTTPTGDSTVLLDSVSVNGAATAVNAPEPGSLPLLAAVALAGGLPALITFARRRRRRV